MDLEELFYILSGASGCSSSLCTERPLSTFDAIQSAIDTAVCGFQRCQTVHAFGSCTMYTDHAADVFGIEVLKHPDHVSMPNMTQLETAFQTYDPSDKSYQSELRFRKPIYLARHNPYMLARAIMDAGRQVIYHFSHLMQRVSFRFTWCPFDCEPYAGMQSTVCKDLMDAGGFEAWKAARVCSR